MQMMAGNLSLTRTRSPKLEEEHEEAVFMLDYLGRAALYLESTFPGVFTGKNLKTRLRTERLWDLVTQSRANGGSNAVK